MWRLGRQHCKRCPVRSADHWGSVIKTVSFLAETQYLVHSSISIHSYGRKGRQHPITLASFSVTKISRMWPRWVLYINDLGDLWTLVIMTARWPRQRLGGPFSPILVRAKMPTAHWPTVISGLCSCCFLNFKSYQAVITSQLLESFFPFTIKYTQGPYSGQPGSLQILMFMSPF